MKTKKEMRNYQRAYRQKQRQDPLFVIKLREYYREWYKKNGRKRAKNYNEKNHKWREEHPKEVQAYYEVEKALSKKLIKKPNKCSKCGRVTKLVGHHPDYNKPLKVQWLCHSCHKLAHAEKTIKARG